MTDRSDPYWEMMFREKLRMKWQYINDQGKIVDNWEMFLFEMNVCRRIPSYDPFYDVFNK